MSECTVNSNATNLTRLRQSRWRAELLMIVCGALAFGWIPAGLILIFADVELRPVFRTLWQLWPLEIIPLCGFGLCWRWRSSLTHQLRELDSHDTPPAA